MTRTDRQARPGERLLVAIEPVRRTEQQGVRPALVVSDPDRNVLMRKVIVCPVTRNLHPWPTKVFLLEGVTVNGAVLVDQIRSIVRETRTHRSLGFVTDAVLEEVRGKRRARLGLSPTRGESASQTTGASEP